MNLNVGQNLNVGLKGFYDEKDLSCLDAAILCFSIEVVVSEVSDQKITCEIEYCSMYLILSLDECAKFSQDDINSITHNDILIWQDSSDIAHKFLLQKLECFVTNSPKCFTIERYLERELLVGTATDISADESQQKLFDSLQVEDKVHMSLLALYSQDDLDQLAMFAVSDFELLSSVSVDGKVVQKTDHTATIRVLSFISCVTLTAEHVKRFIVAHNPILTAVSIKSNIAGLTKL